jgi:hypothetical protein
MLAFSLSVLLSRPRMSGESIHASGSSDPKFFDSICGHARARHRTRYGHARWRGGVARGLGKGVRSYFSPGSDAAGTPSLFTSRTDEDRSLQADASVRYARAGPQDWTGRRRGDEAVSERAPARGRCVRETSLLWRKLTLSGRRPSADACAPGREEMGWPDGCAP